MEKLTCKVQRTGFRPYLSDSVPAAAEKTNWANDSTELEMPTIKDAASM